MEMWFDHTGVDERGIHRKRTRPPQVEESADIDLTPMLDVVMIMLIFFIVAGSFIHEVSIEVERKQSSTEESSTPSENIGIQISANNEIWLGGRRIDSSAVRANISRMRAENPKASVNIQAHNASTFDAVASVVNASREAGVYTVALSTGETGD
jgi:biopolymer transport protein ExbD